MIIGTTLDDAALGLTNFDLDEDGLKQQLQKQLGANADRVYKLYRDAYPKVTPFLIQASIATDRGFRRSAYKQAELKAAQGRGPAYFYLWEWPVPAFDGKFGAVHGVDVGASVHDFRGAINGSGSKEGKTLVETSPLSGQALRKRAYRIRRSRRMAGIRCEAASDDGVRREHESRRRSPSRVQIAVGGNWGEHAAERVSVGAARRDSVTGYRLQPECLG